GNRSPPRIWCLPLRICNPSVKVNRLRRFHPPAALFGPADVMPESPVVVTPPLTTIPPSPRPATKERLSGNEANGAESRLNPAREKPARNVFNIPGERIWVSCTLATCIRNDL